MHARHIVRRLTVTNRCPMKPQNDNSGLITRLVAGIALLGFGASHGITGLLANLGWYTFVGIDFDAWYMHPAYQSLCWFAIGIASAILVPMWIGAICRKSGDGITSVSTGSRDPAES